MGLQAHNNDVKLVNDFLYTDKWHRIQINSLIEHEMKECSTYEI